jgi:hypothetical protein
MLLTSCGDTKTGEPGTAIPTPSSTSSAKSTSSTLGSTSTTPPQETCAAFLPTAQCSRYSSVSGTTGGNDLPWVASGGVKAWLTSVNGELQLTVTTRCGPPGRAGDNHREHAFCQEHCHRSDGVRGRCRRTASVGDGVPEAAHRTDLQPGRSQLEERNSHTQLQQRVTARPPISRENRSLSMAALAGRASLSPPR